MTSAGSTSIVIPSPVQSGQAPCGLLNEKLRGSISPSANMSRGQASCSEKMRSSSSSSARIRTIPSPSCSACSMLSASRPANDCRSSSSAPDAGSAIRSTTTSIEWRLFFSSAISSSSERTSPSIRARTNPRERASSSTCWCSPLRSRITGASTSSRDLGGSASTLSTICCTVCWAIGSPQSGQCGRPARANSSRR